MRLWLLSAIFFTLCVASLAQTAPASASSSIPAVEHFSIEQIDKTLDPCTDFFQYACSKWLEANPIPPDQGGWGTFNALAAWNVAAVRNTLEEAAKPSPTRTAIQEKVGDYYASCMDEDAIDKAGLKPLQPALDRIARMKHKSQLPEVGASIHQIIRPANVSFLDAAYQGVLFGTYSQPGFDDARVTLAALDQAGMALPGREFYLNDDATSKEIREKYVKHVARMLELSGESPARAAKDAQSVLAMETDLAKAAMDIILRRDGSNYADHDLGEAVGQAYVAKYFPPDNKERMQQVLQAIKLALDQDINAATWMSDTTKKAAHAKLAAQVDKIGYPDHWRDYSSVEIKRDDFLGNVQRSAGFEIKRRVAKFGQPSDRYEWAITPPTVDAYEDAQGNTINFSAGILQPPFFDAAASDAINYGAIGAVIGHEITHGYDDQGRKFDADGNLKDWWTAADAANYEQRDKCITDEYTQDVPEAGVKQNGKLSAGEDTADNGGVHIALAGLDNTLKSQGKSLDNMAADGVTESQNFFLAYANVWCGEVRPEIARTAVMTQGHSLARYRVNNVLGNMPEFAHAYGCHAGQPMVHANACRVW